MPLQIYGDSLNAFNSGLEGVEDSLGYRTGEIERHLHSFESWFETAATPSGEVHVADRIGGGSGAFQIDAGNDDWGGWVQLLGSSDTPARTGGAKYDLHRVAFAGAERNAPYFFQLVFGASGDAGLAAGESIEAVFVPLSNQIDSAPVDIQSRRKDANTKAWARCKCPGQDTATLDFYFGLHEYEG